MSIFFLAAILGTAASVSSSEAASTGGKKPLTPIIAGTICGGLMVLAWSIGFTIYFMKRYKRRQRHRLVAAGKATPKEKDLDIPQKDVIIPPDPAVLLGHHEPGEIMFPQRRTSGNKFRQSLPCFHQGSREEQHPDKDVVTENISSYAVHDTAATAEEEDAIIEEMTVPKIIFHSTA